MSIIYIGKIWQSRSFCLCFESNEKSLAKKSFLHLQNKKISFQEKKPSDIITTGQVANLARKYLSGKILTSIQKTNNEELWLFFNKRGEETTSFYLRLKINSGGEISLISQEEMTVIFRYSTKGTYTRIKSFTEDFPEKKATEDLTNHYLEVFKQNKKTKTTKQEETKEKSEEKSPLQQEINKKIKRKIKTLKTSLTKLKEQIFTSKDLELLSEKALQLQNHLYMVKEGMTQLELGLKQGLPKALKIELIADKSPGKNLEAYFKEVTKKKKAFTINQQRLQELENNIKPLEQAKNRLSEEVLSSDNLYALEKNLGLGKTQKTKKKEITERLPYKIFVDNLGVKYFVGKAAADNDALVKKAKSQDLWFHVVGTTGSHVIVPYASTKTTKNLEPIKKNAAILALYYSKKKNDKAGEVYHAPRHMVSKKKGQAPGLWTVKKAGSFYVTYDDDELKKVLNLMTNTL